MGDDGAPTKKKRCTGHVSREELDKRLDDVEGQAEHPWWNHRLLFAARLGLVTEHELKTSLSYRVTCVKTSLRSIGCPEAIQARLRLYSIATSKIHHRLGAMLNMCVVVNKDNPSALLAVATIAQDVQQLRDTMLTGVNETPPVVAAVLRDHPGLWDLGPRGNELAVLSSWDQAKTYIANRFVANVQVHVKAHLEKRVKRFVRESLVSTPPDEAMKIIFANGDPPVDQQDKTFCDSVMTRLRGLKLLDRDGFVLPKKQKVPVDVMMLHFELAFRESSVFQPLPMATTVTRVHARVCERIYQGLTRSVPECPSFDAFVRKRIRRRLRRTKWTNNSFRRARRSKKAKKHGSRKVRRKRRGKQQVVCIKKRQQVDSFETDGYSVSLALKTPHTKPADNLTPKELAEQHLARLQKVANEGDCWVAGDDPGRKNMGTQASLPINADPLTEKATRVQFTRDQWNRIVQTRQQREWEASRRVGGVKKALDALSDSGGKRTTDVSRWKAYITASLTHRRTLHREFLENDDRQRRALLSYGRRRRAVDTAASSFVDTPDGKPLIIGYGDGSFKSHGRGKNDTSVPVKALYRAIVAAFKKKRIRGGVIKVWEYFTTAKCHRCHHRMEKIYKDVNGERFEDRDFRRCIHCNEECPKLRNRDWNAALNIRVVVLCLLRGEDRPEYLKPEKRETRKRKRS